MKPPVQTNTILASLVPFVMASFIGGFAYAGGGGSSNFPPSVVPMRPLITCTSVQVLEAIDHEEVNGLKSGFSVVLTGNAKLWGGWTVGAELCPGVFLKGCAEKSGIAIGSDGSNDDAYAPGFGKFSITIANAQFNGKWTQKAKWLTIIQKDFSQDAILQLKEWNADDAPVALSARMSCKFI